MDYHKNWYNEILKIRWVAAVLNHLNPNKFKQKHFEQNRIEQNHMERNCIEQNCIKQNCFRQNRFQSNRFQWNTLFERAFYNPYSCCLILGLIGNLAVETLSRKSPIAMGQYLLQRPLVFLYNSFIIAFTLSAALLVKRRAFVFSFLMAVWIGMGVINSILLVFRTTPFTAVDLRLIEYAYALLDQYFSVAQLILIGGLLLLAVAGFAVLFLKMPKQERLAWKQSIAYIVLLFLLLKCLTWAGIQTHLLAENFGNINQAFRDYGFPYGFSSSLVNTGIDKPKEYSVDSMEELLEDVTEKPIIHNPNVYENLVEEPDYPNVIYLQLESFFDPAYVRGIHFSREPLPTFTLLKEECTSGFLKVPSVGAGTANTEFEVITGMNLDFFGPGEYPYKTILQETTCESLAYNLKELGYCAHAIHNNEGTFYERNEVFSRLGFDTFTSIEYMRIRNVTPLGWAKDEVLIGEIRKALKSTAGKDVIYTISVQGHGSYPTEQLENPTVQVSGFSDSDKEQNDAFEYYVNQIYEMDQFVHDLTTMLQAYPEQVMLILYGDHLPGFGLEDTDLENGSIYQTEYVIWTNYPFEKQDRDLEAYQLSSYVMWLLGFQNGILTKYHQLFEGQEDYLEGLQMLEYDMLYGEQEIYDGENPYQATQLQMGTEPVQIFSVYESAKENCILVRGRNFTEYSYVRINGKEVRQEFVHSFQIRVYDTELADGDFVEVHQIGKDGQILSTVEKTVRINGQGS